ncbi:MAG TPA: TMEM175 family protein [Burkholderiales bacterium]|nr:TMEM175 family protein [Burkholderiales bacterium]
MKPSRLEAFSDGVLAIIITIMVLELKVPHGQTLHELAPVVPVFLCYVLSFVYLGIYWNNHHHMLHTCEQVTGAILWANLHLLFWRSLIPFVTGWKGRVSPLLYVAGILRAFRWQWAAQAVYVLVALIWLIPDRRIERALDADRAAR